VKHAAEPTGVAQPVRYPLFRWPDADTMRRQHALVAEGRAHALYESWRPLCRDERLALRRDAFDAPAVMTLQPLPALPVSPRA